MSLRKLEIREAALGGGEVEIFELDTIGGGIVGFYQGKGKKEDILSRGHDVSSWQKAHDGFSNDKLLPCLEDGVWCPGLY